MCNASFGPNTFADAVYDTDAFFSAINVTHCTEYCPSCCGQTSPTGSSYSFSTQWQNNNPSIVRTVSSSNTQLQLHGISLGSFGFTALVTEGSCQSPPFGGGGSVTPCPTGVVLDTYVTKLLPSSDFPADRTGVGLLSQMAVTPSSGSFNGTTIQETITPTSNTCPTSIKGPTDFPTITLSNNSTFLVGSAAQWEKQPYPAVTNQFYDSHRQLSSTDVLNGTGVNQCTATATQVYYCGGKSIATFHLSNTYTHGTLSGQSVTNVATTKQ